MKSKAKKDKLVGIVKETGEVVEINDLFSGDIFLFENKKERKDRNPPSGLYTQLDREGAYHGTDGELSCLNLESGEIYDLFDYVGEDVKLIEIIRE